MRLFAALRPDPDDANELFRWSARSLSGVAGARRIRPEDMHVTLVFCGDVPDERAGEVAAATATCAADAIGGSLRPVSVTRYGNAVVVLLEAADDEAGARLAAAREALAAALVEAGLAAPDLGAPWTPHVTVARTRDRNARVDGVAPPPAALRIAEAVVYRSTTTPEGARYTLI